jgi:hypothetical protein
MSDLIPQTTNPARDLYKYLFGIVQHTSPRDLIPGAPQHRAPAFIFRDGRGLFVLRDEQWVDGKPALSIGGLVTVWANGHFIIEVSVVKPRWANCIRDSLAQHTFLQWTYHGNEKIVYVQTHKRVDNSADHWSERIAPTDWNRARPYLPCDDTTMLPKRVVFRLVRAGATDWKIRAARLHAPDQSNRFNNGFLRLINADLDQRYGQAERRYARYKRKAEIESWRAAGYTRRPRERTEAQREEIIRTFIDHSIVFEPKSTPPGQIILPFPTREEAMSHGR